MQVTECLRVKVATALYLLKLEAKEGGTFCRGPANEWTDSRDVGTASAET